MSFQSDTQGTGEKDLKKKKKLFIRIYLHNLIQFGCDRIGFKVWEGFGFYQLML